MVQIIEQFNPGGELGKALGQGLQSGIEKGFERGQLQSALGKMSSIMNDPNIPLGQKIAASMQVGALIPESGRYMGELIKSIPQMQQQQIAAGAIPRQTPQEGPFGAVTTPSERNEALRQAQMAGATPETLQNINQSFETQQINRQNALENFWEAAKSEIPGMQDKNKSYFMEWVTRAHPNVKNPEELMIKAKRDWPIIKRRTDELIANMPGLSRGILSKFLPFIDSRQKVLKDRFESTAKQLKELYGPALAIEKLMENTDLSLTEADRLVFPYNKQQEIGLKQFPDFLAPYGMRFKSVKNKINKMINFLDQNIDDKTSLLALRHDLWQKGFQHKDVLREIKNVLRKKQNQGQEIPEKQLRDIAYMEMHPPRDSLFDIFTGSNLVDILKGKQ